MKWKRYGNSTIGNIPINFKLEFKSLFIMISVIYEFVGSFFQNRENHIEGHGQLENNMVPPI
jgi:hypothetical protein